MTGYAVGAVSGCGCTNFAQIATPTATTYKDTTVSAGTSYGYRVRATDAAGNLGPYSNAASAITPAPDTTPPTQPGTLTATAVSASEVDLSWGASTDNVGVTGYLLERCRGRGARTSRRSGRRRRRPLRTRASAQVRRTAIASAPRTRRAISVPYSNTASATPTDTTPPSEPGTLTATAVSGTEVDLSWGASTDNVGVTGYVVRALSGCVVHHLRADRARRRPRASRTRRSRPGRAIATASARRTPPGNLGPYSNTAGATTPAPDTTPPSQPGTLTATAVSSGEVDLSWGASTDNVGVTGYRVERCQGRAAPTSPRSRRRRAPRIRTRARRGRRATATASAPPTPPAT